jgi:VWFA-related protein
MEVLTPFIPAQQGRDDRNFTISVDVDLVVFNLMVTDKAGHQISGLKDGDFRVYEDGKLQTIKLFDAEDVPASVGLIIDNSGSMRDKQSTVTKAAVTFLNASNPADEMFLVRFNERVDFGLASTIPFTSDMTQMRSALLLTTPFGMTALYDALSAGIDHLKAGTHDRKALVVLSDGGDNASHHSLDDVLQSVLRSNATIYTIGIYDDSDPDRNPQVLRKIAQLSGGRAYFPKSLDNLENVWRDIAGNIRSQYTIGYSSDNSNRNGGFRKVKIVANRKAGGVLRVTTRNGYIAPNMPR